MDTIGLILFDNPRIPTEGWCYLPGRERFRYSYNIDKKSTLWFSNTFLNQEGFYKPIQFWGKQFHRFISSPVEAVEMLNQLFLKHEIDKLESSHFIGNFLSESKMTPVVDSEIINVYQEAFDHAHKLLFSLNAEKGQYESIGLSPTISTEAWKTLLFPVDNDVEVILPEHYELDFNAPDLALCTVFHKGREKLRDKTLPVSLLPDINERFEVYASHFIRFKELRPLSIREEVLSDFFNRSSSNGIGEFISSSVAITRSHSTSHTGLGLRYWLFSTSCRKALSLTKHIPAEVGQVKNISNDGIVDLIIDVQIKSDIEQIIKPHDFRQN